MLRLPIPVSRALRKFGHDIKDARRRRRIPMAIAAERASISKPTFIKVERNDPLGLQLEEENLPQRIRGARKQASSDTNELWRLILHHAQAFSVFAEGLLANSIIAHAKKGGS